MWFDSALFKRYVCGLTFKGFRGRSSEKCNNNSLKDSEILFLISIILLKTTQLKIKKLTGKKEVTLLYDCMIYF